MLVYDASPNPEDAGLRVYIFPLDAECLARPEPEVEDQVEKAAVPRA